LGKLKTHLYFGLEYKECPKMNYRAHKQNHGHPKNATPFNLFAKNPTVFMPRNLPVASDLLDWSHTSICVSNRLSSNRHLSVGRCVYTVYTMKPIESISGFGCKLPRVFACSSRLIRVRKAVWVSFFVLSLLPTIFLSFLPSFVSFDLFSSFSWTILMSWEVTDKKSMNLAALGNRMESYS